MIIFDTETTGLVKPTAVSLNEQPEIIELAAIKLEDKKPYKELERIEFLCKPKYPLSAKITEITGLTDKDLEDQPKFSAKYPYLCEFFRGEFYLIGHNVKFDVDLLSFELQRMGRLTKFPWPPMHICTVEATVSRKGFRLNQGLLYEELFGDIIKSAHRAMADVEVLVKITKELIKTKEIQL